MLQEEEWSLHLQRDSQYYLDRYDCVSEYDNSDAQCCLPLGIFLTIMSLVIDDEAKEGQLSICGVLLFTAPTLPKGEKL